MAVTKNGAKLAQALEPSIGMSGAILEVCSRLCRAGRTYLRLQEQACNGYQDASGNWDEAATKRAEAQEERLEQRIHKLCEQLPRVQRKPIVPIFQGYPRGATVKLKMPDGRTDDWGATGICVPGS